MADGRAPLQEDNVHSCLSLHAVLRETAFNADRSQALTRCCHLMSAVLTDGVSLPVTGSGHHFVTAKSKLTTQTSQNVMQLILKVFHSQREKQRVHDAQLPPRLEGCHAAAAATQSLVWKKTHI